MQDELKTLWLIGDEDVYGDLTARRLKRLTTVQQVEVFENCMQALNCLHQIYDEVEALPEVIVVDNNLPMMDGWAFLDEYAKILNKLDKEIKIFILISPHAPLNLHRAESIDFVQDFIFKPVTAEALAQMANGGSNGS